MKLFKCTNCGQLIYFENTYCQNCNYSVGFDLDSFQMLSLDTDGKACIKGSIKNKKAYRYCFNFQYSVCNWLIEKNSNSDFCKACELNRTIPDLSKNEYRERWRLIEVAKHRVLFSLFRMNLPVISKQVNVGSGLVFDFKANETPDETIYTGHNDGTITINIAEADDIEREMVRRSMHESYRTLLGHFRHEIGHYYWDRLIRDTNNVDAFRTVFGDERANYKEALEKYYEHGATITWNENYISAYASSHPWEDWAETWAHYMHIIDTLETAYSFGLSVDPLAGETTKEFKTRIKTDPYIVKDFDYLFRLWLPLTFAMNSLNRSMGTKDPYPFVITSSVKNKIAFIHDLIVAYTA
ncbi:zinc-binding metallopeptidase family protein [Ferruginibacter albus]|uniref:zinc-binding metallopeptidase family protein n=1 Tax=Ferruginibacter albus TaxID=2875540 RepID=UPI001CC7E629|nr:putative zinc-binding metallopeptidase [Ferruginibacter albus]UAY53331.1 putative zinc-binding peptidase [Ferruginibacter albus]